MPVEVKGLDETLKALRHFEPDLAANLNKEVRAALAPVQKRARSYAKGELPGLSNWVFGNKISKKSSAFGVKNGQFPKYNATMVKRGIKIMIGETKPNNSGFVSFFRLSNTTAAGAIMETAGRKNPRGQQWKRNSTSKDQSHSDNPDAGLHFNNSLGKMAGRDKMRGRLIYRAWEEDHGIANAKIIKAVERTIQQFHRRADAQVLKRIA
jgi:hypothetical protein